MSEFRMTTIHKAGTIAERLAKAAALARVGAHALWEAGVILREVVPDDASTWAQHSRRINYDLCTTAQEARDLAAELDESLPHAREAQQGKDVTRG